MTPSNRIPPASASRYAAPQDLPAPSPDVAARAGSSAEDASPLRDRKAVITQPDPVGVSRKRKRQEDETLPPDPFSVVREQKYKQSRHAINLRSAEGEGQGEGQGEGDAEGAGSAATAPAPASIAPPPRVTAPISTTPIGSHEVPRSAIGAASNLEADPDLSEEYSDLLHGERVSIYSSADPSSPIATDTLLYENAVYTQDNETIAISTNHAQGVYTHCIGDRLVWIFSSPRAVGLLVIRNENIDDLDVHFPQGLAEFMTVNGSSQGIRVQLGYSPQGYRAELIYDVRAVGVESTRTRLGLAAGMDEPSMVEMIANHAGDEWRHTLSGLASTWGAEPTLVEISNEAVHISQEGIDLFESEPYAQRSLNLDAPPGS